MTVMNLEDIEKTHKVSYELQEYICNFAASTGDLKLLIWARQHGYPWTERTLEYAVQNQHYAVAHWATEHGCPTKEKD